MRYWKICGDFTEKGIDEIKKAADKHLLAFPAAFLIFWILWLPKFTQVAGFWKWVGFVFEGVNGPQVCLPKGSMVSNRRSSILVPRVESFSNFSR